MFRSIEKAEIYFSKKQERKARKAEAKQDEAKALNETTAAVKPLYRKG